MKLGIIGSGMIAHETLPYFLEASIEVVAIAGTARSHNKTCDLARTYGIDESMVFDDYTQLIALAGLDAVYVAVPNYLHYEMTKAALLAGKSVICEKPLAATHEQAQEMARIAREAGLFLWEAIVPMHQPSFAVIKDAVSELGEIRIAQVHFCQYSSRYNAFMAGTILPALDPACAGGALMDLGVYNLSMLLGLFGAPKSAQYVPNIQHGIDTSGIMTLDYGNFKALGVCSKDSNAPSGLWVQGTSGYLVLTGAPSDCGAFELHFNDGRVEKRGHAEPSRFLQEFTDFRTQWEAGDRETCYAELEQSLEVSRVLHGMRREAGITFPADEA